MKKLLIALFAVTTVVVLVVSSTCFASASSLNIASKEAVLMSQTGEILFEHNATEKRPIASMTKIMTLICTYDAIRDGKVSLDDNVVVSTRASSMGGSQVFLAANSTHKLGDLIKSVVVCSANDSCVALAEHISGSVEKFVDAMNKRADDLNLRATHFENCTGLPQVNQYSCAVDVAKMMWELIKNPNYFTCANIWMEDYKHPDGRVIGMTNTNKLVRFYNGCDGGKTGYTSEAMHCLSATAKKGDTRFVAVVIGAPDSKTRFAEVSALFNYAFANYESKIYLDTNTPVSVDIAGGSVDKFEAVCKESLIHFGEKGKGNCVVEYQIENVVAPVKKGDIVGEALLLNDGKVVAQTQLIATIDVAKKPFVDYLKQIVV